MGKVDRLRNRVQPFCCTVLGSRHLRVYVPLPDPARRSGITPPTAAAKACPYMVIVGSILNEDASPPPSPVYVLANVMRDFYVNKKNTFCEKLRLHKITVRNKSLLK